MLIGVLISTVLGSDRRSEPNPNPNPNPSRSEPNTVLMTSAPAQYVYIYISTEERIDLNLTAGATILVNVAVTAERGHIVRQNVVP